MSTTIAIVLEVTGDAWAEAPDGSRRALKEGDALMAGERLITADDARVQLDFGYDNTAIIDGGVTILATAEMASDFLPSREDTELTESSINEALASIEAALGGAIEDAEAPAAGIEGGSSGGNSSVRLARILENTDPTALDLELAQVQFEQPFTDNNDGADADTAEDVTLPAGTLVLETISGGTDPSTPLTVSGSSSNLSPGTPVRITITDQAGNSITQDVDVGADGSFTGIISQFQGLIDGPITIDATSIGANGGALLDSSSSVLNATDGALQLTIDAVDNAAQTISVSGSTSDVAPGERVNITITDSEGNVITVSAEVGADGTYSVIGQDVSGLVDGNLTIAASATDRNGEALSDGATGILDALAGDLSVTIESVDYAAQTTNLAGTSSDVAPGETVSIRVTDSAGNEITTTAVVGADGSYSLNGLDISGLVDGALTVDASATDRNGDALTDDATAIFDATAGNLSVAINEVDNAAQTIDISGTTADVASGELVELTITDSAGNEVSVSAEVGADGGYSIVEQDISTLVDGDLTVDASATDRNGGALTDDATGTFDATAGNLSVAINEVDNAAQTIDISGTTADVAPGQFVELTITDSANNTVTVSAEVGADGSYSLTGQDISGLVDGSLTVDAAATDRNGQALTDGATGTFDTTAGNLSVAINAVDNTAQTIDISGTTADVAPGEFVELTITDSANNTVTVSAEVGADGSYSVGGQDISTLVDGTLTVDASATDRNGQALADDATATFDATAGNLSVAIDAVDNAAETIDISGTTADVAPGEFVGLTITDSAGNEVSVSAEVGADGSYSIVGQDISDLVDGALTVDASATDRNGVALTDDTTAIFDATAGNLSVAIDAVDNAAQTIDISGTTADVAPGEFVGLTITDSAGTEVTVSAEVGADGSYSIFGQDISNLVDGALTVDASATDRNGQALADDAAGTFDTTAGNLSVAIDAVNDGAQTIDLSGTTTDVAPGEFVELTITDSAGTEVNVSAEVGADGSYSIVGQDISTLVDGALTVDASATDRNGDALTDSANGTFDATAGVLSVAIDEIDNSAQTIDISGTTTDVAPGQFVELTITDSAGNDVIVSAQVGADGSYSLTGQDISTLVDGALTVDATATDRNGGALTDDATGTFDATTGTLSVAIEAVNDGAQTIDLSGTTTDVAPGQFVELTVTDSANNTVIVSAEVGADGSYSIAGQDISTLVDGALTVDATATDRNGGALTDDAAGTLDATTGTLSVAIEAVNDGAQTIDLSGTTIDVAPGQFVELTITDSANNVVTVSAEVGADGSYSVGGQDISGLVDGALTVDASATDRNGGALTDDATGTFDATAGTLSVAIDEVDNSAQTINISGNTNDVAPGQFVELTITDSANNVITVSAQVGANGGYSLTDQDIFGLVDGALTVDATATDRNGDALADSAAGTFDATVGALSVAINEVDNSAQTIDVSGTTSDVAPGEFVELTITDSANNTVIVSAEVGANGGYTVIGQDISTLVDGTLTVDAAATDRNGGALTDDAAGTLDATTGTLSVAIEAVNDGAQTIDLSGTTTDVAPGQFVELTITDSANNVVTVSAEVGADGSYSVGGQDISTLVDGTLTVDASATDRNGQALADDAAGTFDATAGNLSVAIDTVNNGAQEIDLSGTTADVAPGEFVELTITDSAGNEVSVSAEVGADGSYSIVGQDISTLVDGALTVDASATDRNGDALTDDATGTFDATAGNLSVAIDAVDSSAQTIDISGTTADVAPGEFVELTITDSTNNTVTVSAEVGADGSYSIVGQDISDLVDGALTVDASATDRNGDALTDDATGVFDATAGNLSVAIEAVNDGAQTIDLSGTTTDVAPGQFVELTVTDSAGTEVIVSAEVVADGSYSLTGQDISGLVDGALTVDASATDRNGGALTDDAAGTLDATAGTLSVAIEAVNDDAQTLDLSGTTTDVAPGQFVELTITDSAGTEVTVLAEVGANGSYSLTDQDISDLVDGALTVDATATDRNGGALTDDATATFDAIAGALSVAINEVDNSAQTIDISGTTSDVAPGQFVELTITDSANNVVTVSAEVVADGSYSIVGQDISGLVDGTLTVDAAATDRNGGALTDDAAGTLDATAGNLSVAINEVDNSAQTIDISGTTTDVAPGEFVEITVTDSANNTVIASAEVGADGSYSIVGQDISTLVDGALTVDAAATDRNGDALTDSATGTFDATAGTLSVAIEEIDNSAQTIDISGTTTDVAPGEFVEITVTDSANNTVTVSAEIGADGSYSLPGQDISTLVDGVLTVDASATDRNGGALADDASGTFDATAGTLSVAIEAVNDGAQTIDLSGTTTDVAPGQFVVLTITDSAGNEVTVSAEVGADGSYSLTGQDISGLVDGALTVDAAATDRNGGALTDDATGTLDATAGNLSVAIDAVNDGAQTIDLSGTTTDVAPGEFVEITITDSANNTVTASAEVGADGSYSIVGQDISNLVDGALTVDASATDRNGQALADDAAGTFDTTAGNLSVAIDAIDNAAQTIDISGTTTDVAPGEFVELTITDSAGTEVSVSAEVGADGSYSAVGQDISTLVDGDLTVDASATDRNGQALTDDATATFDATAGNLSVAIDAVNDGAQTIDLSGTTTDVAPGQFVELTITDSANNAVTVSAEVGADGSYSIAGQDISTLVDGALTVDASATDRNSQDLADDATATFDATTGNLSVAIDAVDNPAQTIDISGTTADVAPGEFVELTITDSAGNEVSVSAEVGADGSYSVVGQDISGLVDGALTVDASATDRNGDALTDDATGVFDATAGNLSVAIEAVNDGAQTIDLSGTTTDVAPGQFVELTITDSANNTVTVSAEVGADGSYSIVGQDISGLVDGALTVDASATDRNGGALTDDVAGTLDATAGTLSVAIEAVNDGGQTIDLSGTTTDVAPGQFVELTVTDSAGTEVIVSAEVVADGSYSLTGQDISGLVDGALTVDASATDRNGGALTDDATGTLDATAGTLSVAIEAVNDGAQTIDLSGTTTDVAPGQFVQLTVTDSANNVVTVSAEVGADGSYSIAGRDISTLVDGVLTVDASATDRNGGALADDASGTFDATAGNLSVAIDAVNDGAQTIDLSGTTTDVAPGQFVELTITDSAGTEVTVSAEVGANGSYAVIDQDISTLVDGALTVDATATDRNGGALTDDAAGTLDATAGTLSVAIDEVDNSAQTINISGSTNDVTPGQFVQLTITDSANNTFTVSAEVGADGSYSVTDVDTSSLDNGAFVVQATGTDRNGQDLSDSASGTLDANVAPDASDDTYDEGFAIAGLLGEYFAYEQSVDGANLTNVAQVDSFIGNTTADATFVATNVDYGSVNGTLGGDGKVQQFLGTDAGSLSSDPDNSSDAIIRLSGELELGAGTYQFRVRADDGYSVRVNGEVVAEYNGNQGANTRTADPFTLTGDGPHSVEIIYWDQGGAAQLRIELREGNGAYEIFGADQASHLASDPTLVVDENQSLQITPATLLGNDTDANGDALTIDSVQNATNGTVSLDGAGNVVFTPDDYYSGEATFSYTVSDGRGGSDTATVTVNVQPTADAPTLSVSDATQVQIGGTIISTGTQDEAVDPDAFNLGSGVSQQALELELGLADGALDGQFDPTGENVTDDGNVNIVDGKVTTSTQGLTAGMSISWGYNFINGEELENEVAAGFNDVVALIVTAPSGARETLLVDSSESKFPNQIASGTFSYTASESGAYQFNWLVLNGGDGNKDSSLELTAPSVSVPGLSGSYGVPVALDINAGLTDQDGSETLNIVISGIPGPAALTAGAKNADGSWTLSAGDLEGLQLLPEEGFSGDLSLDVTATSTETATGESESVTENLTVTVNETSNTIGGTGNNDTLIGGDTNDLIRGYDGDDTLDGNAGSDYLIGGAGSDSLTGGADADVLTGGFGADVFRWELGDESNDSVVNDVVTDFTIDPVNGYTGSGEGDQLELSDLLQDASADTITDYLMAQEEDGDTVLYLNTNGALADNSDNAQQSITLSGVTMDGQTSDQFIDSMLNSGQIKIE